MIMFVLTRYGLPRKVLIQSNKLLHGLCYSRMQVLAPAYKAKKDNLSYRKLA